MHKITVKELKMLSEAAGILKLGPMDRSMLRPWRRKNEVICVIWTMNINEKIQMGMTRTRSFTSSTCVTLQSRHGLTFEEIPSSRSLGSAMKSFCRITAALSRNLHHVTINVIYRNGKKDMNDAPQ